MRIAIDLDGQSARRRVEIENIAIDAVLTSELDAKLIVAETPPEPLLRTRRPAPEAAALGSLRRSVEMLRQNTAPFTAP